MMEWNVNEIVWVKLTDFGMSIHHRDHLDFLYMLGKRWSGPETPAERFPYKPPEMTEDGWSRFQGWRLMQLFGPHMQLSGPNPFQTSVRFEDKHLSSVPETKGDANG
jgi:hypothetical protein